MNEIISGYLSDNMQRLLNQEMFAVVPLPGCPHLPEIRDVPESGINVEAPCATCGSPQENWTCLICYSVSRTKMVYAKFYIRPQLIYYLVESTNEKMKF